MKKENQIKNSNRNSPESLLIKLVREAASTVGLSSVNIGKMIGSEDIIELRSYAEWLFPCDRFRIKIDNCENLKDVASKLDALIDSYDPELSAGCRCCDGEIPMNKINLVIEQYEKIRSQLQEMQTIVSDMYERTAELSAT